MKVFIIYWKNNKGYDVVEGKSFIGALRETGYNSDVIYAIKKWEQVKK